MVVDVSIYVVLYLSIFVCVSYIIIIAIISTIYLSILFYHILSYPILSIADAASAAAAAAAAPAETSVEDLPKLSNIEIKNAKPDKLKEYLKERGQSTQGNKSELIKRLMDFEAARK